MLLNKHLFKCSNITAKCIYRCVIYRHVNNWNLLSAVCLRRLPKITPELNWLEKKMLELSEKVEVNDSLYSDHEMRHFEDLARAERIAAGVNVDDKDLDAAAKQTAQDFVDTNTQELNSFTKTSRITHADEINDKKSLERCLDRHLMFVCNQKIGEKHVWSLPQVLREDGETMRQAAERALNRIAGNRIEAKFLGNIPSAVYCYLYPRSVRDQCNAKGAKIFIFKAIYLNGDINLNDECANDYNWLNRSELEKVLLPNLWHRLSQSLLIEDYDISKIMNKNRKFRLIVQKKFSISQ